MAIEKHLTRTSVVRVLVGTWPVALVCLLAGCVTVSHEVSGEEQVPVSDGGSQDLSEEEPPTKSDWSRRQRFEESVCQPHGQITDQQGRPVSGANIELLQKGDGPRNSWIATGVTSDDAGQFELPSFESCPLRLAAWKEGSGRGEETSLPLAPGQAVPARMRRDLILEPARPVTGTLLLTRVSASSSR